MIAVPPPDGNPQPSPEGRRLAEWRGYLSVQSWALGELAKIRHAESRMEELARERK
jgi:hypothetical protein